MTLITYTLDDYAKRQHAIIDKWKEMYLKLHADQPENFPLTSMTEDNWDEYLSAFKYNDLESYDGL